MAGPIYAVVAADVLVREQVSFGFIFGADAPDAFCMNRPFGTILRQPRGGAIDVGYVGRRLRGEEDPGQPSTAQRWNVNLGENGSIVMGGGVDEAPDEAGLVELIKDVPACTVLVRQADLERIRMACDTAGVELITHSTDKILATA